MAIPPLTSENTDAVHAAIYLRQSFDKLGDELAVSRQLEECAALCEERGWTYTVYEENNTSATKGARRTYRRLLDAIEAGEVDTVVVWNLDRLHRQPIELEQFLALARRTGIAVTSCTGDVDLATDDGRMFARMKGVMAIAEVERKTARQLLAMRQLANSGRLWWGVPAVRVQRRLDPINGAWWVVKHDPKKKRTPEATIYNKIRLHPTEAALVKRAYEDFLKGVSLHTIAKDWNEAGVKTPKGNKWRGAQVRQLLLAERNAGLGQVPGDEVTYVGGNWPDIVSEDVWRGAAASWPIRSGGTARAGRASTC